MDFLARDTGHRKSIAWGQKSSVQTRKYLIALSRTHGGRWRHIGHVFFNQFQNLHYVATNVIFDINNGSIKHLHLGQI